MSYTDVFGSDTVPPSDAAYASLTLTANTSLVWPYNTSDTDSVLTKILDVTCSAGVVVTLPPANEVSPGEDFLLRNVGSETLTLKDNSGVTIDTIASGISKYYFITDNSTVAGVFGKVTYGAGASAATAGDLIGYGIKAASTSLNQAYPVSIDADNITIDATFRAKTVVSTGGACTVTLGAAGTLGDDFFFLYHNAGTGTATINPDGAETFDGAATFMVQPGESLIAVCSGTTWYSVGYGRSTLYQFTQLVKDVSAAGSFTLTAAEASNKLLSFTGNPASAVTIVVPNTVAIYYCQSTISTAQSITVKTAAGTGSAITQTQRQILICDGTNVTTAQSATVTGSVSFDSGSAAAPSLNFTASTNTGLFLKGTNGVGITANGVEIGAFETTGLELASPMAITEGGTGRATSTTAYGLIAAGTTATGAHQTLPTGSANNVLLSGGAATLPGWANEATFKAALNLEAGVDFQAYSANLDEYAAVNPTAAGLALLDDVDAAAQRTTLGLGSLATQNGTFSGTSSGTNTGDNAVNALYNGLVSNATHTGDVTGSTTLTIANDAVTYAKMQNVSATDKLLGRSTAGAGDVEEITCTAAGRAILDDADATAQRVTLGLVIGTNVQAYDAELTALAGLTSAANKVPMFSGSGTATLLDFKDEDDMLSNSATAVPSQQSVKAYVDAAGGGGITLRAPTTLTTGSAIEFNSIPAGTKHIVIMGIGVSTGNTSPLMCRIGDTDGIETTGYVSSVGKIAAAVNYQTSTAGFLMSGDATDAASDAMTFKITLDLEDSTDNTWVFSSHMILSGTAEISLGGGHKALSATLDRINITTVGGTANFDAGEINISYQG